MTLAYESPALSSPAILPAALVATSTVGTLRWATAGYASRPTDLPADTVWDPRLLGDVTVSQGAIDAIGLGGVVALTSGDVEITDGDNAAGALDRYGTADGRAIRIRALPVRDHAATDFGASFGEAQIAFAGLVRSVYRRDGRAARVTIADGAERLNVPLQTNRYAGTGGAEGGANLAGTPKPILVGRCYNVAPVSLGLVNLGDGALETYQLHWRAIEAVDAVRIRGVPQTLVGTAPTVGQARAWLSQGVFQLGSAPDGPVTADARGDNAGGYVSTTAQVVKRLLTSLGPQVADGDFDADSVAFADSDFGGEVGWSQGATPVSAVQAVSNILGGCGAVLAGARDGRLHFFDPIARDVAQFTLADFDIVAISPVQLPAVVRPLPVAVVVQWRRNWSPLSTIAAGVAAEDRQRLAAQSSGPERVITTGNILRQASQRDLSFGGLYWSQSDAAARATQWRDWLDHGPRLFEITTDRYLGLLECGHIGRVTFPAYGLDSGALGVVMAWRETIGARRLQITFLTLPEG
jgi:hypothetical protein